MKIEYSVTGSSRKTLVTAMGEILGVKPKYLGMPTAAYTVGDFLVDRNGTVSTDGNGLPELVDSLSSRGILAPELALQELRDQVATILGTPARQEQDGLTIEMPEDKVNFENLTKLLSAKGNLIKKSLGIKEVSAEQKDRRVSFHWFTETPDADTAKAATALIAALCRMSVESKRITATEREVDNEKYTFRCFLLRLGFIGNEYKEIRKTLLKNMNGNSAFKSGAKKKEDATKEA